MARKPTESEVTMLTTCIVPGCGSSSNDPLKPATLLRFPKAGEGRTLLLTGLGMDPGSDVKGRWRVCTEHFEVLAEHRGLKTLSHGWKLKPKTGAGPVVIQGTAGGISINSAGRLVVEPVIGDTEELSSQVDGDISELLSQLEVRDEAVMPPNDPEDIIGDYAGLKRDIKEKLLRHADQPWRSWADNEHNTVRVYLCDRDGDVLQRFFIDTRLKVTVGKKKTQHRFGNRDAVLRWSELRAFLNELAEGEIYQPSPADIFNEAAALVRSVEVAQDDPLGVKLEVIANNLENLGVKSNYAKRYSSTTMLAAATLKNVSPAGYSVAEEYFNLPSKRTLRSLAKRANVEDNKKYFRKVINRLKPYQRLVNIQIDGMKLKESVDYYAGQELGFAENKRGKGKIATEMQAIMVSGTNSKLNEIVRLFPVANQTAAELEKVLLECVKFLQEVGFTILSVIADNHATNASLFKILTEGSESEYWFKNPDYEGKRIYCFFDSVHLFKNIRNGYVNYKSSGYATKFMDWDDLKNGVDDPKRRIANFKVLQEMADRRGTQQLSEAWKLTYDVVHLTTYKKQSVKLAQNLYDPSTQAAIASDVQKLKKRLATEMAKEDLDEASVKAIQTAIDEQEGNLKYLKTIWELWCVWNVKSPSKGYRKRLILANPIRRRSFLAGTDERFNYLKDMLKWVEIWGEEEFKGASLTDKTHHALRHTLAAHISMVEYIFENYEGFVYILMGKFQTDQLERRFGKYRYLNGSGYECSVRQVLDAEKKVRLRHMLNSSNNISDVIRDENQQETDDVADMQLIGEILSSDDDYFAFEDIFLDDFPSELNFDEEDANGQQHCAGYAAHSFVKKMVREGKMCGTCEASVVQSKGQETDQAYQQWLQRGGLSEPAALTVSVCLMLSKTLEAITGNTQYRATFDSMKDHKKELLRHALRPFDMVEHQFIPFEQECSECGMDLKQKILILANPIANILLKADAKRINNIAKQTKEHENRVREQKKQAFHKRKLAKQASGSQTLTPTQRRESLTWDEHVVEDYSQCDLESDASEASDASSMRGADEPGPSGVCQPPKKKRPRFVATEPSAAKMRINNRE
jgi:hypothetical protein